MKGMRKAYGEQSVLQGIDLDIASGERVGVVGENGAGKSTLLRLLAGEEEPDAGTLHLPGQAGYVRQAKMQGENTLSGGERTQRAIKRALAARPPLLLLDEPTNNLDGDSIRALLRLLQNYPGTVVAVSHDRYFLDRLAQRIVEIEDGRAVIYPGNYSDYRKAKEKAYADQLHRAQEEKKRQAQLRQAIAMTDQWAEKAHRTSRQMDSHTGGIKFGAKEKKRAQAKKLDSQAKSHKKRLERLLDAAQGPPREEPRVAFALQNASQHGRRVLEAEGLGMVFGTKRLFADSSFTLLRGEHAALYGPNGCGKSTLVRLISGQLQPSEGTVFVSGGNPPYVLTQSALDLPEELSPLSYLTRVLGTLSGAQRSQLFQLGLSARLLEQPIGALSLGERMKVKLAALLFSGRDFLVLDEPTNYLDLHARERLEQALRDYMGTLLLISHDVYFLRAVCDKTLVFQDGRILRREESFASFSQGWQE